MTSTDSPFALPDGLRGLVISTRVHEQKPGTWRIHHYPDPQDLRWALLFWDRLAWPSPHIPPNTNEAEAATIQFLQGENVLVRPKYPGAVPMTQPHPLLRPRVSGVYSDLPTEGLRKRIRELGGHIPERSNIPSPVRSNAIRHLLAFLEADLIAPGAWALANDVSSLLEMDTESRPANRGLLVSLFNCIPVPDSGVPLADVLQFKKRRNDELITLRAEVENLYLNIQGDRELALRTAKERLDRACADAIRVARESRLPFRLSAVKASFALPVGAMAGEILAKGWLEQPISLPSTQALLVGAASTLALAWDIAPQAIPPRDLPYRYITSMHRCLT